MLYLNDIETQQVLQMGLLDMFRRKSGGDDSGSRNIENEQAIRQKLNTLCARRHPCDFQMAGESFSSILLAIRDNLLLTDMMIPLSGNTLLRSGQGVRIAYLERRMPYLMNCLYQGRVIEDGFESLSFTIPTIIHYSNRRSFYRVSPGSSGQLRVLLDMGLSQILDAEVIDISGGGLAVRSRLTNYLQPGREIDRLDIIMSSGHWISCQGRVVRLKGKLIGIKLLDVNYQDRQVILRYVTNRQQEDLANEVR